MHVLVIFLERPSHPSQLVSKPALESKRSSVCTEISCFSSRCLQLPVGTSISIVWDAKPECHHLSWDSDGHLWVTGGAVSPSDAPACPSSLERHFWEATFKVDLQLLSVFSSLKSGDVRCPNCCLCVG